jgi:hypothetical protein
MAALPDTSAADPGSAQPASIFWIPALIRDALLLVLLPRAAGVALAVAVMAALGWVVRRPPVSLALAAAGMPLFNPVGVALGDERIVFAAAILFVLLPGTVLAWGRLWDSRRGPSWRPALRDPVSWLVAALGVWLVCGLAWTSGPWYGVFKAKMYFGVNLLLYAGAAVYLRRGREEGDPPSGGSGTVPAAAVRFLQALLWLQVAIALTALWNWFAQYYASRDNRLRTLGLNAIWTARYVGLGMVVLLGLHAMGRLRLAVSVPVLALLGWVFLRTGSRGPLAAMAVTLTYWALTAKRARRSPGLTRAVWFGAGAAVLAAVVAVQRTAGLFAAGRQISNLVRTRLLGISVEALSGVSLRGLGTGGFPSLLQLPDGRLYPHNIFLEVLLESGLIGLALFLMLLAVVLVRWQRWGRRVGVGRELGAGGAAAALHRTAGAVLLFVLVNAQFSGDLSANEWVWMAAGMIVAWAPRDVG